MSLGHNHGGREEEARERASKCGMEEKPGRERQDSFPWVGVDFLIPAFWVDAAPFPPERKESFLRSRRIVSVFSSGIGSCETSCEIPSFQTGPKSVETFSNNPTNATVNFTGFDESKVTVIFCSE
ncbi:unnamed protein product, partial [Urochloa humidicola]